MSLSCMDCARAGTSCCNHYQIVLTTGDIERMASFLGHQNFFTIEPPILEDMEPDYDPDWLPLVLGDDTRIRVLKRDANRTCFLLSATGCSLPAENRPLICRLYPYTYNEEGILGIDHDCPISKEMEWGTVLERLDMPAEKAKQWLSLLYAEVKKGRNGCGLQSS